MTSYVRKVDIVKDSANVAGRKKIVYVDASSDTTVPAGTSETITIQPPAGKIWGIITSKIIVDGPGEASSGTHELSISLYSIAYVVFTRHTYNSTLFVIGNAPHNAAVTTYPETKDAWQRAFSALKLSHDYPLYIKYINRTDADQTNPRIIRLLFEEGDEAT